MKSVFQGRAVILQYTQVLVYCLHVAGVTETFAIVV